MNVIKVRDYDEMSQRASQFILEKVRKMKSPVLGLATGSTPEGLYRYLVKSYVEEQLTFHNFITFNLDEYVGLGNTSPNSYYYYMQENFFQYVDIPSENIHLPNGMAKDLEVECRLYEERINGVGNIDIQVLGLGLNGHIGFNEPGTAFTSRTHVVELDESTRKANSKFFTQLREVPKKAITMGIETILESKEILLLVSGENKSDALAKLINGEVSEQFPASILKTKQEVTIIADEAALRSIEEYNG
jgi:glucosamine-6-phosphate deaminase